MPPQSRGVPAGFQSKSTPNLHARRAASADTPPEPASRVDFSLDLTYDLPSLSPGSSDDDEDAEEEEDGQVGNLPTRALYHHHSRSHTHLAPSAFAPPFYNRPPTPLPPSPSLTSLLRPNFGSQTSRPTTPDPSSDEGGTPNTRTGTQTPNSAAASTLTSTYRAAKPIPRASPRVPTYEYYGFTLYLISSLAFIGYLLWAFLPAPFLLQLGISYYPNRWWALAIPAWTVMFILYIYVALALYNTGSLTLPLDSVECLVDEAAYVAIVDARGKIVHPERLSWKSTLEGKGSGRGKKGGGGGTKAERLRRNSVSSLPGGGEAELDWRNLWNEGTDAVMDIPVGGVCEILYGATSGGEGAEDDVVRNAHDR